MRVPVLLAVDLAVGDFLDQLTGPEGDGLRGDLDGLDLRVQGGQVLVQLVRQRSATGRRVLHPEEILQLVPPCPLRVVHRRRSRPPGRRPRCRCRAPGRRSARSSPTWYLLGAYCFLASATSPARTASVNFFASVRRAATCDRDPGRVVVDGGGDGRCRCSGCRGRSRTGRSRTGPGARARAGGRAAALGADRAAVVESRRRADRALRPARRRTGTCARGLLRAGNLGTPNKGEPYLSVRGAVVRKSPGTTLARMTERLSPGDQAPDFTLPDADGKPVALADYRGRKVIVYFYPAAIDARLHQGGLRLPGQPRRARRRRLSTCSASPRTSRRSWPSSATREHADLPAAVRPRPRRSSRRTARTARRRCTARRSGRDPLDVRHRRGRHGRAGAVQRQGHRPRRQAPQEARSRPVRRAGRREVHRSGPCPPMPRRRPVRRTYAAADPRTGTRRALGGRAGVA